MSTRPKPLPFSETLPILLLRARRAVTDHFRPAFQAHGVTEQQWRVLRVVSEAVEIEMTPLAEQVRLLAPVPRNRCAAIKPNRNQNQNRHARPRPHPGRRPFGQSPIDPPSPKHGKNQ